MRGPELKRSYNFAVSGFAILRCRFASMAAGDARNRRLNLVVETGDDIATAAHHRLRPAPPSPDTRVRFGA
jgi:hypothetical protein